MILYLSAKTLFLAKIASRVTVENEFKNVSGLIRTWSHFCEMKGFIIFFDSIETWNMGIMQEGTIHDNLFQKIEANIWLMMS